jgi:hypothetical protein
MPLNEKIVSDLAEKLGMPEVLEQFRSAETPADGVNPLADKLTGLHVFGQTQLDERLTNERTTAAEEARRTAVGNTYGAIDSRILADTGIPKKENEKTADYVARAAKEKYGTKGDESAEMTRLRTDLEDAKTALQTKTTELDTLKVTHATEAKALQINSKLDLAINGLSIEAPADKLDSQRRFLKYEFEQKYSADVVEGRVEFKDKATGEIVRDPTTRTPLTEAQLIAKFAPTVVSIKTSQKRGAGVDDHSHNNNQESDDLAAFANIDDYKKHLTQAGVVLASSEGQEKISKYLEFRKAK